ncbi:hypothetical protein NMY22_g1373 [Coprinellus aureogranulatus]|nr:hypothetical protein NMY22_g1373 [Coprinellus aureogranulatus]
MQFLASNARLALGGELRPDQLTVLALHPPASTRPLPDSLRPVPTYVYALPLGPNTACVLSSLLIPHRRSPSPSLPPASTNPEDRVIKTWNSAESEAEHKGRGVGVPWPRQWGGDGHPGDCSNASSIRYSLIHLGVRPFSLPPSHRFKSGMDVHLTIFFLRLVSF